jgi:uncharacterized membrane protein YphA (DoxX/SURF4 family)
LSDQRPGPVGPKRVLVPYLLSPWIFHPIRLFIGGLFLYTGAMKLADTVGFGQSIAAFGVLPAGLVSCAAIGLPVLEVGAGFGTLLNRRWGILAILAMMVMFMGVLSYGVAAGLQIDCGCFSTEKTARAEQVETFSVLEIPEDSSGLLDGPVVEIDPVVVGAAQDETCSEEETAGSSSLKAALVRDVYLMFGVMYLVAWPDLRRRWGIEEQSRVQSPESRG